MIAGIKTQYKNMQRQINNRVIACMQNADFIMGSAVHDLENRLAEYVGVKHVVSCGSGTDALQMICMAYLVEGLLHMILGLTNKAPDLLSRSGAKWQ